MKRKANNSILYSSSSEGDQLHVYLQTLPSKESGFSLVWFYGNISQQS